MPKPKREKKPGRNDPCWCGSGRKYKDCHLPIEEAYRSEQLRLRQSYETLLPKIIEAAQQMNDDISLAFDSFWKGKYAFSQIAELDELDDRGAERFLTWFAFDYALKDARTLVQRLAAGEAEGFMTDEFEARLLTSWQPTRLGAYLIEEVHKGKGVQARDLLRGDVRDLSDYAAAKRMAVGEVLVGHLLPVDTTAGADKPNYYLAGAAAQLTADTAEKLIEYAGLFLVDLQRENPAATWDDLLRTRSAILNHFVMVLPREEYNPTLIDDAILEARVALKMTTDAVKEVFRRDSEE